MPNSTSPASDKPLSEDEIQRGYELAGLPTEESREAFRSLRLLAELTALTRAAEAQHHRTSTTTSASERADG